MRASSGRRQSTESEGRQQVGSRFVPSTLILALLQLLEKLDETIRNRLTDQLVISFTEAPSDLTLKLGGKLCLLRLRR
jgi:hypothetical protein